MSIGKFFECTIVFNQEKFAVTGTAVSNCFLFSSLIAFLLVFTIKLSLSKNQHFLSLSQIFKPSQQENSQQCYLLPTSYETTCVLPQVV